MDRMVSELSMLSKLNLDKIPFYFEKVNVAASLDSYANDIRNSLENGGVEFEYERTCPDDIYISIDIGQSKRVIRNLIQNCKKYKDTSKPESRAKLTVSYEDGNVEFVFEDNGIGVADSEYEKIFDSFYRSDKARSNAQSGSGLGLAITKQIVERHSATISADRSSLGGLAVKITIPETKI